MKSSYDLAMERLGGPGRRYTPEQKEQLAEIERVYEARIAQARLNADTRLREVAGDAEKVEKVRQELATDLTSLNGQRDRKKEELRKQFGGGGAG